MVCHGFLSPLKSLAFDVCNFEHSQVLTVTVFTAIVLAALLFEDDDFIIFLLVQHGGLDTGARNSGRADFCIAIVTADEQNVIQRDRAANFGDEFFHFDDIVFGNSILLTTGFNDCVHEFNPLVSKVVYRRHRAAVLLRKAAECRNIRVKPTMSRIFQHFFRVVYKIFTKYL